MYRIHIADNEMNETTNLAITGVFRQVESHSVEHYRHEDWERRLESMLPFEGEAKLVEIERLASLVLRNSKRGNNALCGILSHDGYSSWPRNE